MTMQFSTGTLPSVFNSANNVITQSIVIPANSRVLYVAITGDNLSNSGAGAPTYCRLNGVDLTLLVTAPASANGQYLWLYQMLTPPVGTFNITTVHTAVSTQVNSVCIAADIPFSAVANTGTAANTGSPSSVMGSTTTGGKVLHFISFNGVLPSDVTEVTSMTTVAKTGGANNTFGVIGSYVQDSTAASTTASWTLPAAQRTSTIALFLKDLTTYVSTFNGSAPVTVGQTGIPVATVGFTAKPTIVASYPGGTLACVNVTGSANAFTFDLEDRSNGNDYPLDGDTVTFTFTNGGETATHATTITKKIGEVKIPLSGLSQASPKFIGYHFVADGLNPEGAEFIYTPYDDLTINSIGAPSVSTIGTFTSWLRPVTGPGAGNVYFYEFTIAEPATSIDLTMLGINSTSPKIDGAYPLGNRP